MLPDQFIDRTRHRPDTFFGNGLAAHVGFADPICPALMEVCASESAAAGAVVHRGGVYVCMEGPQFSTRAESFMHRGWGADVIGMTNLQEAKLAREAEICYATLALITDYDCWHEEEEDVTVEAVLAVLRQNARTAPGSGGSDRQGLAERAPPRRVSLRPRPGARTDHRSGGCSGVRAARPGADRRPHSGPRPRRRLNEEGERARPMRLLLTNDDGVDAPGLRALAAALDATSTANGPIAYDVVAPLYEQSGCSQALTLFRPLRAKQVKEGWFAVDGTPADCVNLALHSLLDRRPDLLVSGVNMGGQSGRRRVPQRHGRRGA